ncbi:two-component sensor histidine kinase [Rhizobium lentis]|uniref:ATP-binding protein n=1 Tax=Rhizobium lentis TaxID=1138194 RepID=UPI001C829B2E|nr:ATP-binding protein [Rhizobium lentis]MBX4973128.1 two-component sensor histidine kinase [Rhizobium lentis]MBX4998236.1 two-component sensor histidine kinase [Rhizobium lentis]MBX5016638.1 two-component sensor histidine kinase [Rhizobium lentis]MBX5028289.1 two-component sensor histidine kinase [Rhizobium lentis]MBX5034334.1 two-component sensor histidine kinase [Rhizobium lentis]
MLARFFAGSIHRQIALLAVAPVVLFAILGIISENLTIKEPESVSQARAIAMRVEFVADMIRSAETADQETAILEAARRTGLQVEEVPAAELLGPELELEEGDFRSEIQKNLSAGVDAKLRAASETGNLVLVVGVDQRRALAFLPPPAVPDSRITDREISDFLATMAMFVPVILLSLYGSRMIASPLQRFSQAARDLDPDKGPERPFDEIGPPEVRTLAKSLNDMRSRVRGMIEARTRMLRAISHDLRTPLTRLRLRAERSTEPSLRAALLADIDALALMVDETLVYLRKDASKEPQLRADLPSLMNTVCNDFADMGYSVSYRGPDRFAYPCRPHALKRAVANLIDNGTKFARHVNVELHVRPDRAISISVTDDGPGIPLEFQADVMEPFYKLDSARNDRGFGLGLSIVKDIVESHFGTLTLANAAPCGLIAEINLPSPNSIHVLANTTAHNAQSDSTEAERGIRNHPGRP